MFYSSEGICKQNKSQLKNPHWTVFFFWKSAIFSRVTWFLWFYHNVPLQINIQRWIFSKKTCISASTSIQYRRVTPQSNFFTTLPNLFCSLYFIFNFFLLICLSLILFHLQPKFDIWSSIGLVLINHCIKKVCFINPCFLLIKKKSWPTNPDFQNHLAINKYFSMP